jgi:hypothetical protein
MLTALSVEFNAISIICLNGLTLKIIVKSVTIKLTHN